MKNLNISEELDEIFLKRTGIKNISIFYRLIANLMNVDCNNLLSIKRINIGMRNYNFIIKVIINKIETTLFLKVNCVENLMSFDANFKKSDRRRQRKIFKFINNFIKYQNSINSKVFAPFYYKLKYFNNFNNNRSLCLLVTEKLNANLFNTKIENILVLQRHRIENYSDYEIKKAMCIITNFHKFSEFHNNIKVESFFNLRIKSYNYLYNTLLINNIDLNNLNLIKSVVQINLKIMYLDLITSSDISNSNDLFSLLNYIKNHFVKCLEGKYDIKNFNIKNFDENLFDIKDFIDNNLLTYGQKILVLESFANIYENDYKFLYVLNRLNELKNKIKYIIELPEIVIHNDIHFLNILENDDFLYIIDFDKTGINKKIYDLGLILVKNKPQEDIIETMFNYYINVYGGNITEEEAELVYDLYSIIYLTNFVREYNNLCLAIKYGKFDNITEVLKLDKYYKQLQDLEYLSNNNVLPKILHKIKF